MAEQVQKSKKVETLSRKDLNELCQEANRIGEIGIKDCLSAVNQVLAGKVPNPKTPNLPDNLKGLSSVYCSEKSGLGDNPTKNDLSKYDMCLKNVDDILETAKKESQKNKKMVLGL